jgi:hypothetical protein
LKDQKKGKWAEELLKPVWSHNTFISRATNFTPFKLLFGEEVVTPKEIKFKSARTKLEAVYNLIEAETKDLLEPERMKALKNLHTYQAEMKAWRDKKVKEKNLQGQ